MRFEAELEKSGGRENFTVVRVPFDVSEAYGETGIVPVNASVNGFEYCCSLYPKRGQHYLIIRKDIQKRIGVGEPGEVVEVRLEYDGERRAFKMPRDLQQALNANRDAKKFWDELAPSSHRYRVQTLDAAKSPATRKRRLEETVELLAEIGRAMRKTPEVIERALKKNPTARTRWQMLSKSHRREFLHYIYSTKSEATRANRIQKMLVKLVEKGHY
jgi:uncharacterized protein YdeI (YjbR/CyaY-like superfamily)